MNQLALSLSKNIKISVPKLERAPLICDDEIELLVRIATERSEQNGDLLDRRSIEGLKDLLLYDA
jgi:hypothetical protein